MSVVKSSSQNSKKIEIAIKKAIGSSNKTLKLILENDFTQCSDILVQIDSAIGSLQSSRTQVIDHFLDSCIEESMDSGDKAKLKNQLIKLYKLSK